MKPVSLEYIYIYINIYIYLGAVDIACRAVLVQLDVHGTDGRVPAEGETVRQLETYETHIIYK